MLVQGGAGADALNGSASADTIVGGQGADTLTGGGGADLYRLARGDSTFSATDVITDFQADDRLDFGLEPATAENAVVLTAATRNDAASQASAAFANSAVRYAAVSVGANLHIFVNDAVSGQEGTMVTLVNPGANLSLANITGVVPPNPNLFVGTDGPDNLTGTAAADTIQGGGGNDIITGGLGADVLSGGSGSDFFNFTDGGSTVTAADRITDFEASDRLDFGLEPATDVNALVQSASSLTAATNQAANAFAGNNELRYVASQVGNELHIFASTANGGQTASLVTLVNPGPNLSYANFFGHVVANPNLIVGASGNDWLQGAAAVDTIQGNAGNDTLIGGRGADVLTGGAGADLFKLEPGDSPVAQPDRITDFTAEDRLDFGLAPASSDNAVVQTAGSLTAATSQASAAFAANAALRYVATSVGNNLHIFASDADGSQSASLVTLVNPGAGLSLANITGAPQFIGADGPDTLAGTPGADFVQGNGGNDSLSGQDGADTIGGGAGSDSITGGGGADVLTGGADNDLFKFLESDSTPANPDQITDFASGDRLDFGIVQGTAANYVENSAASLATATTQANAAFAAGSALRYIATQVGNDVQLFVTDSDGGETHSLVTLKDTTTANIDFANILGSAPPPTDPYLIVGTDGADTLVGNAAPETINGLSGADTITGGGNADLLSGGGGDDLFKFAAGDSVYAASTPTTIASYGDRIADFEGGSRGTGTAGGTGDQLDFGFVRGTATNYLENAAATKEAAVTQANVAFAATVGLRYVATQVGGDVLVFASAGGQTASVVTLSGTDVGALSFLNIAGTAPSNNQILDGTAGRDTLVGGTGNDVLTGFADSDSLSGGAGNDTLLGGDGQDTLIGGLGNDRLSGGANEDRFMFGPGDSGQFFNGVITPGTADIVTDFQSGIDVLTFGQGAAIATPGSGNYTELSTLFTTYASAETAAQTTFSAQPSLIYVVTQVGSDSYVFVDTGGTTDADSIIYLQGVALSGIAAADIV